jgi:hypothetical protein
VDLRRCWPIIQNRWTQVALVGAGVGVGLLLGNQILDLNKRVWELERLLSTDEAELTKLAASPSVGQALDASLAGGTMGPIEAGVCDALAGYQRAGYNKEQAESLAQEVLRIQVKEAGGWSS